MTGSSHTRHHSNVSHVLFYISTKKTKPMVTYLSALKFSNQPLKRGSKFTPSQNEILPISGETSRKAL